MDLNKVMIIGRLGMNPDVKTFQDGKSFTSFSVATSKKFKRQDGTPSEKTEWHKIAVFGKQAEMCGQYLSKGKMVFVEGELETRSYEDKTGVTKYVTEIKAQNIIFLSPKEAQDMAAGHVPQNFNSQAFPNDDQIPF